LVASRTTQSDCIGVKIKVNGCFNQMGDVENQTMYQKLSKCSIIQHFSPHSGIIFWRVQVRLLFGTRIIRVKHLFWNFQLCLLLLFKKEIKCFKSCSKFCSNSMHFTLLFTQKLIGSCFVVVFFRGVCNWKRGNLF